MSRNLPIRYLGLPLTTQSLTKTDYEPLIDKIRTQMLAWSNKTLSYAGRLQLIKSVIVSIVNFWSSAFILPAGCLDSIERLCNAFLWSGSPNDHHKTKISWSEVSVPKGEGGLGIRKLRDTSKVFALSLIWRLFTISGSLWVAWTRANLLRNISFWEVKETQLGSWIWRKLLKMRVLAYPFMRREVRNGKDTFFWHDDWLRMGRLITVTGDSGPSYLRIPSNAKVSEAVADGSWRFGNRRLRRYHDLFDRILDHTIPTHDLGPDVTLWRHSQDKFMENFSATQTWNQLRKSNEKVSWDKIVWFTQGVPRYAFITWLAFHDRLTTGVRMRQWGTEQCCMLCGERDETRDHLFFACPYSFTIWNDLAGKLIRSGANPDWSQTIQLFKNGSYSSMDHVLLRLLLQVTIYHIWRERNSRRNKGVWIPTTQLTRNLDRILRNRILALNYKSSHKLEGLMRRWFWAINV